MLIRRFAPSALLTVALALLTTAAAFNAAAETNSCRFVVDGRDVRASFAAGETAHIACLPQQAVSDAAASRCRETLVRTPISDTCRRLPDMELARCVALERLSDAALFVHADLADNRCALRVRDDVLKAIVPSQQAARAHDIRQGLAGARAPLSTSTAKTASPMDTFGAVTATFDVSGPRPLAIISTAASIWNFQHTPRQGSRYEFKNYRA
jgi:hypothetical protein